MRKPFTWLMRVVADGNYRPRGEIDSRTGAVIFFGGREPLSSTKSTRPRVQREAIEPMRRVLTPREFRHFYLGFLRGVNLPVPEIKAANRSNRP